MKRNLLFLSVCVAALALLASGCGEKGAKKTRKKRGRKTATHKLGVAGIDFDRYWPREEIVKLTPEQRASLLELALAGLKGNNWEHARDVLVAMGKQSMPALIKQVESTEATYAGAGPLPVVLNAGTKTLGQISHDVLLQIVEYHSSYKGHLPARKGAAWEGWWKQNQGGLKIK
jgi:hypothetical protein